MLGVHQEMTLPLRMKKSRVISALNGVSLIITLLISNLRSPLPLQVGFGGIRRGLAASGLNGARVYVPV